MEMLYLPTPTPYPTAVGTPVIQLPVISSQFGTDAVQAWNMFGGFGTAIQVALILVIILGGLTIIIRGVRRI